MKPAKTDVWFAWRPVRVGVLGRGPWRWLVKLWRNRCWYFGPRIGNRLIATTIYQDLPAWPFDKDGSYLVPNRPRQRDIKRT